MKKNRRLQIAIKRFGVALLLAALFSLCACGKKGSGTTVVLTTGLAGDEIFRIENKSCRLPEIMVYLTTTQNQYEEVYGEGIWEVNLEGVTLEENVKEMALARIAQIKTLNLMAEEKGVTLDEDEQRRVKLAAEEYYSSLNETEIEKMGVTPEVIEQLYAEYALAEKVYRHIIQDINLEISDDEARTITVSHILIKTYMLDGRGNELRIRSRRRRRLMQGRARCLHLQQTASMILRA